MASIYLSISIKSELKKEYYMLENQNTTRFCRNIHFKFRKY